MLRAGHVKSRLQRRGITIIPASRVTVFPSDLIKTVHRGRRIGDGDASCRFVPSRSSAPVFSVQTLGCVQHGGGGEGQWVDVEYVHTGSSRAEGGGCCMCVLSCTYLYVERLEGIIATAACQS